MRKWNGVSQSRIGAKSATSICVQLCNGEPRRRNANFHNRFAAAEIKKGISVAELGRKTQSFAAEFCDGVRPQWAKCSLGGNAPKANMVRVALDQEANHTVRVMVIVDRSHYAG
ncbi:hypothetical protein SAMN03159422_05295 [Agrobacterium fabrum]|nr:hypothetical protein [Agrobacterium fabrum]SDB74482.1 hypothetical protein SAMN03159422_05295 [Agrobacterium fabrum]SES25223.1 hypothetical protein SAMN03159504_05293 [Agrobacterium fabrum]